MSEPVEEPHWVDGPGTGRKFLRAAERVADFVDMGESTSRFEKIAPAPLLLAAGQRPLTGTKG